MLSDKDFEIATKYMNAFNKDPGYWEGESKIKGVSKIELVVHFAKYTNDCKPNDKFIHKSSNFYLKLIQEQPDLFKDMMASMLDGETKYDLDKLEGIFKYKFYSKNINKVVSEIDLDGLRNYFYEISKKKDKDLKEFIKNNENRKNIASKLDTISFSGNEKFDTYIGHINNMTRFLNERPIKNRTVLYRGEQTDRLLNTQNVNDNDSQKLGDAIDSFIKNNKNDPVKIKNFVNEKLKERTFVQKEFMSTTLNKDLATSWAVGRYTGRRKRIFPNCVGNKRSNWNESCIY